MSKKFDPENYVRFREVKMEDIPEKPHRQMSNKWEVFLEEFLASEFKAVEVEQGSYKSIHATYTALKNYLKKTNWNDLIEVTVRKDHLYVINKDLVKTAKRKAIPAKPPKRRGRPPKKKPIEDEVPVEKTFVGIYKGSASTEVDHI